MFKRLPFRLSSSPDIFQKVMAEMFEDIEGVEVDRGEHAPMLV